MDEYGNPKPVNRYEGIWIINTALGTTFVPPNPRGDFSEFFVAQSIAEDWADEIMAMYDIEYDYEVMVQVTYRLSVLLDILSKVVREPEHPHNPTSETYRINLN